MASNIDPERPNVGVPRLTKDGFEDNFTAAKDEIEDLQDRVTVLEGGGGGFSIDQYDIAARLTAGTGAIEAVDIATLTEQASPASADDLFGKRDSDGALVRIEVGNLPSSAPVASVFSRAGVVVATSGDYDDSEVTAAASATNYTPASSTVDGHLSGIDTALGTVGAVASVFTRTGAVVAVSGDYDADEIDETASNKIMTAAERTKLAGIETAATADQTGAEIKTAYEGEADTNAFTDAEQTKLSGIATGATDDTTVDAHIADAVAAHDDSAIAAAASATNYTPGGSTVEGHLSGIDTALGTVGAVASVFTRTGAVVAVSGDYDADEITETASNKIMTAAERTKLAGIETAATADQTNAEIKTAYEANADTNEFSDAEQTKLAGVATGATDDTTVDAHIADAVAAHDDSAIAAAASATNYTPGASTVEGHLSGIDTALGTVGAVASVFSRTGVIVAVAGDYDDAEVTAAASATNYTPGGATVDGHLSGIDTALGTVGAVASVFGRTGVVVATSGDYTASEVTNVAAGDIVATTVQAAIDELDTEKAASSHTHTLTDVTDSGALAALATVDTAEIDNGAITLVKMADMATDSFIGRDTAATGVPEVLSATTARTILNVADGSIADVVSDTTPQLGGNLDTNSNSIFTLSNADLNLSPNGTGAVSVSGVTDYENNVTADDDIPNKKFCDDTYLKPLESFIIAASDKTTALTTGTNKSIPIRMPYAFTVSEVRCNVQTAPTGSVLTVDINDSGTTILSTKLTIDATETTSTTAATAAVISDAALADDAEITIDIDTIGSTVAGAGLVITIIGNQT